MLIYSEFNTYSECIPAIAHAIYPGNNTANKGDNVYIHQ